MRTRTDFNGKTTTYTYDSVNRLLSKTPDPSLPAAARPVITFTYDPTTGKRLTMDDASGHTSYQYDIAARLQQVTKPAGQVSYDFDLANNVTALFGTGAGTVTYTYDALNRLKSGVEANTGTSTYTYDAVGNLASVTYPNGVVHAYTYDNRNRLTNLGVNKAATPLASYAYTLDPAGHRTSVTELSGRTVNYSYDNLYRLTSETISGATSQNGTISYTYDPVGNRKTISSTVPAIPAGTMFYDANDRFTAGDTYDNNGNTVTSGGVANVYDFENHLIQKDGITMLYDGDGNRVQKTVAGVTTKYLVDDLNPTGYAQVIAEIPSNTSNTYFVWGLEQISRRQTLFTPFTHLEVRFFTHDGHGSVRQLTDAAGAITDTYDYDAFGNLTIHTGTTPNNYLFAGEQFDPDLNLYNNRARYLDVRSGRFWTMDTLEGNLRDAKSLHKYLFAMGDPVGQIDPSGLYTMEDLQVAGASIVTLATTAYVTFQNVASTVYLNLYRVPTIIEQANNYLTIASFGLGVIQKLGENLRSYSAGYSRGPGPRGFEFEEAAGANLAPGFQGIDYWDPESGTAVQLRSTTQTQTMDDLLRVVRKGTSDFNYLPEELKGYYRDDQPVRIQQAQIKNRVFFLGIPAKPLPFSFGVFLRRAAAIANSEKVILVIQYVEGLEGELPPPRK